MALILFRGETQMTNKKDKDNETAKIRGILAVNQNLWDFERQQILQALGLKGSVNPRAWSTEALVTEINDCVEGNKILHGQGDESPAILITSVVELALNDPELQRAWQSFPDPVAENHGYTWEYLVSELMGQQWIHVFSHELHPADNRRTYARVPARAGWAPKG
jgi:hypothetical protein